MESKKLRIARQVTVLISACILFMTALPISMLASGKKALPPEDVGIVLEELKLQDATQVFFKVLSIEQAL